MVTSLPAISLFQPSLATNVRCHMKPPVQVGLDSVGLGSSRMKWVWASKII